MVEFFPPRPSTAAPPPSSPAKAAPATSSARPGNPAPPAGHRVNVSAAQEIRRRLNPALGVPVKDINQRQGPIKYGSLAERCRRSRQSHPETTMYSAFRVESAFLMKTRRMPTSRRTSCANAHSTKRVPRQTADQGSSHLGQDRRRAFVALRALGTMIGWKRIVSRVLGE